MKSVPKMGQTRVIAEKHLPLPSDIVRLLDILARIEMRRQTKQRLIDKEKAS